MSYLCKNAAKRETFKGWADNSLKTVTEKRREGRLMGKRKTRTLESTSVCKSCMLNTCLLTHTHTHTRTHTHRWWPVVMTFTISSRSDSVGDVPLCISRSINLPDKWPWVAEERPQHRLISSRHHSDISSSDVWQNSPFSFFIRTFSYMLAATLLSFTSTHLFLFLRATDQGFKTTKCAALWVILHWSSVIPLN